METDRRTEHSRIIKTWRVLFRLMKTCIHQYNGNVCNSLNIDREQFNFKLPTRILLWIYLLLCLASFLNKDMFFKISQQMGINFPTTHMTFAHHNAHYITYPIVHVKCPCWFQIVRSCYLKSAAFFCSFYAYDRDRLTLSTVGNFLGLISTNKKRPY